MQSSRIHIAQIIRHASNRPPSRRLLLALLPRCTAGSPPQDRIYHSSSKRCQPPINQPSQTASPQHIPTRQSPSTKSLLAPAFWKCKPTWRRAGINTFRCLVGCTLGDFTAMWYLQSQMPELGIGTIMAISMASGLTTSMMLETVLLRMGRDRLAWMAAARTAVGMSLISMLTMEAAQNMVDYHLTGGVVAFDDPAFWVAAGVSMAAGFLAPLPYNYVRLKKYGRACH